MLHSIVNSMIQAAILLDRYQTPHYTDGEKIDIDKLTRTMTRPALKSAIAVMAKWRMGRGFISARRRGEHTRSQLPASRLVTRAC